MKDDGSPRLRGSHDEADTAVTEQPRTAAPAGGQDEQPTAPPQAGSHGRRSRRRPARSGKGSLLSELPVLLVVALGLALLIKAFLVQAFFIPSGSMQPTLDVGDRVLVNKIVYDVRDIHRGEIVVFNGLDSFQPEVVVDEPRGPVQKLLRGVASALGVAPPGERDFIKRVVGVPGDRVSCDAARQQIAVNGKPLDETRYVFPGNAACRDAFTVTVPEGRLWVMGDHRDASADSRAHIDDPGGGTVPADKVIGRAFVVVWPVSHWRGLPVPGSFDPVPAALGFVLAVPVVAFRRRSRRRSRHRR